MALNLADRITIMNSPAMQTRIAGAVVKYARHLLGQGGSTDAQKAWAKGACDDPSGVATRVSRHLIDDPAFLGSGLSSITGDSWSGGSSITDAAIQGAAETAINAHFIVEP